MIVVIVGPTGVGKTSLSVKLAKEINAEIISGDSVQVYKHLNIGSAKVTEEEKEGIVHHLVDFLELSDEFSSSLFQKLVREKIKEIEEKGKNVIICGGTGYYIKSSLYNYEFNKKRNDENYSHLSNEEIYNLLKEFDEDQALKLHPNNRIRITRALENAKLGHKSTEFNNNDEALYDFYLIGLTNDREIIYDNINKRVDKMMELGLLEEVISLLPYKDQINAIGYNELFSFLNNEITLEEAVELIKRNSRRYAKRQFTWFNNQMKTTWINVKDKNKSEILKEALSILNN